MRSRAFVFAAIFALALALAASACSDSSPVTAPSTGNVTTSAANVAGDWSGTFSAWDPASCSGSTASASFHQNGAAVTGILKTSQCGVAGSFKGTMHGNLLTGAIDMPGCVGGGVTGLLDGSTITLSIGDMTKPLVTDDMVIMAGGALSLHR